MNTHHTSIEIKPTEHAIQTQIMNFLKYKGWYVMRLNSGKIPIGVGKSRRMIQMAEVGTPDLMAFRAFHIKFAGSPEGATLPMPVVRLLFIEVKRPKGVATLHQKNKMVELESYGAECIVVHSVEEVEEAIA